MDLLCYDSPDSDYELAVSVDYVVRFSKSEDGSLTLIHLKNGEILLSKNSIRTLSERMEGE